MTVLSDLLISMGDACLVLLYNDAREMGQFLSFVYFLFGWYSCAVYLSPADVILAQLSCPLNDIIFCLKLGITNLSLFKNCSSPSPCLWFWFTLLTKGMTILLLLLWNNKNNIIIQLMHLVAEVPGHLINLALRQPTQN